MENSNNAVLVRYSVSAWNNIRNDKKIGREIAKQKGINPKLGKYQKCLISSPFYDDMVKIGRSGRFDDVYPLTLPWEDGKRLIDGRALDVLVDRIQNHVIPAFNKAADALAEQWDGLVEKAKSDLTGIDPDTGETVTVFDASDYPTAAEMRNKCQITFTVSPIEQNPQFDGIAKIVGTEMAETLAETLKAEQTEQWGRAAKAVWQRLYDALKHAHDKLAFGQRMYASDLDNLARLSDLLPVLNITNDPELDKRRKELNALLRTYSTQAVKDKSTRSQCASDVSDILSKINL